MTVLLDLNTQESQIVTGFGAPKKSQSIALIGWKANRQAFACVEAVEQMKTELLPEETHCIARLGG